MPTYKYGQQPVNNYNQSVLNAAHKLELAKALKKQILASQQDPNAMVSGRVVPINGIAQLMNMGAGAMANYQEGSAQQEQGKIEDDRRNALAQALSNGGKVTPELLANNGASPDDFLKFALANQPKEVDQWKNTPTGYRPNPDGTISSMIDKETGKPYSEIQLERAMATKQQPGYGQEESNARAEESLKLQKASAARSEQQQQISNANEQERLRMSKESAAKQEQYHQESKLQQVPAMHKMAYMNNSAELQKIDNAIAIAEQNPDAFGLQNVLGDTVNQRIDPAGTEARAKIAEIGAVKRHDLSGAAITASETPSLLPFVPSVNDNKDTIIKKLKNLKASIQETNKQVEQMYSNPAEYKNPITPQESAMDAIMRVESGGNVNAVSPTGARGPYQILPSTGRDPGKGQAPLPANATKDQQEKFAGEYILNMLKANPDWTFKHAASAYNIGEQNVKKGKRNLDYENKVLNISDEDLLNKYRGK